MKKLLFISLFIFQATISCFAQRDTTTYGVVIPKGFTSQIDIVYAKTDNWEGKMDIYLPPNTGKPTPIVINIHGGGWNHGSKEEQKGFGSFFKNNVAVANMSYRLVQVAPAPAAIQDVRSVMIYLVKHAKELNIDPDKIILMGGSAGGHLALMGGYLQNNPIFDINRDGVKQIKAAAVIDKYGITDLTGYNPGDKLHKSVSNWLNKSADKKFIQSVSPIYYVDKDTPPTFIVHGDADPLVPYQQSVELVAKLKANNIQYQFITVEGGEHGKFTKEKNTEISEQIIDFLREIKVIG